MNNKRVYLYVCTYTKTFFTIDPPESSKIKRTKRKTNKIRKEYLLTKIIFLNSLSSTLYVYFKKKIIFLIDSFLL